MVNPKLAELFVGSIKRHLGITSAVVAVHDDVLDVNVFVLHLQRDQESSSSNVLKNKVTTVRIQRNGSREEQRYAKIIVHKRLSLEESLKVQDSERDNFERVGAPWSEKASVMYFPCLAIQNRRHPLRHHRDKGTPVQPHGVDVDLVHLCRRRTIGNFLARVKSAHIATYKPKNAPVL